MVNQNQQARVFPPGPITQAQQAQQAQHAQQQAQLQGQLQGAQSGQQQANLNRKPKAGNGKSKAWQCAQSQMWAQLSKTKMCKYMVNGTCTKGAQCNFAHNKTEIQALPDLSCTKLCKTFVKLGICDKPGCEYAHTKDELRATSDFHKTKLCRFWPLGNCELGSKCRFAHTSFEIRPSVAVQKLMQQQQQQDCYDAVQHTNEKEKEIDAHGRLVVNRDKQRVDSESRTALVCEPCDQDMSVQCEPQDQMMMQGGYQQQSYPPKPPALPHYPPPLAPQQQQERQMQHQSQQLPNRQSRQQRLFQQHQYSSLQPNMIMKDARQQRSQMKNAARQAGGAAPLCPVRPRMPSDSDPEGFGDSDYDPTADYGIAPSDDSGQSGRDGTPPPMWSNDPNSSNVEVESRQSTHRDDDGYHKPGPMQGDMDQSHMVNWAMPGIQGQMQGQPIGMVPMVPVWAPMELPAESGEGTPSTGRMDQSYSGGQMRGNSDHQQQFANNSPQAMSVPYGWRPMIGVMMAPPNSHCAVPSQGEDGSWQVKNTFVTYSPDGAGQMYPVLTGSVNSADGRPGNYIESTTSDAPWMGQ